MSQEETDYVWLDNILSSLYCRGLVNTRPDYYRANGTELLTCREAKIKIIVHLIAQAKQHQVELLRARIDELELSVGYTTTGNKATRQYIHKRLVTLQDELDRLESEGV